MPTTLECDVRLPPGVTRRGVRALADAMLAELGRGEAELGVLLTGDVRIHELNRTFRAHDEPTDVLAFPMDFADPTPELVEADEAEALLGDVVISVPTATRQARSAGRTVEEEIRFLLAHGLLHLLGYDHQDARQRRTMTAATRRLLDRVAAPTRAKKPRKKR